MSRIFTAIEILSEWLGDGGKPVPIEVAQARANTCLHPDYPSIPAGQPCPHNWPGGWKYSAVARFLLGQQSKLKEAMNIHLEGEENLKICDKCGCVLRLKVHVPFPHLYEHTSEEQFASLPEWCWQKKEYYNHIKNL